MAGSTASANLRCCRPSFAHRGAASRVMAYLEPVPGPYDIALRHEGMDTRWKRFGTCGEPDVDSTLFFSEEGRSAADKHAVECAKIICRMCPVQVQCLEYALEAREEWWIWGGTTGRERRVILKARRTTIKEKHAADL